MGFKMCHASKGKQEKKAKEKRNRTLQSEKTHQDSGSKRKFQTSGNIRNRYYQGKQRGKIIMNKHERNTTEEQEDIFEIKFSSRTLIKEIYIWSVPIFR